MLVPDRESDDVSVIDLAASEEVDRFGSDLHPGGVADPPE